MPGGEDPGPRTRLTHDPGAGYATPGRDGLRSIDEIVAESRRRAKPPPGIGVSERLVDVLRRYREDRVTVAALVAGLFDSDEEAVRRLKSVIEFDPTTITGDTKRRRNHVPERRKLAYRVRDLADDILPILEALQAKEPSE